MPAAGEDMGAALVLELGAATSCGAGGAIAGGGGIGVVLTKPANVPCIAALLGGGGPCGLGGLPMGGDGSGG